MTKAWNRRVAFLLGWTVALAGCSSAVKAPVADRSTASPSSASAPAAKAPEAATETVYHVVQPGETLRGIARQYGVTTAELISLNQLSDPNRIVVGQRLKIREGTSAAASPGTGVQVVPVPVEGGPETVSAAPVVTSPKGGRTGAEAVPAPVAPKAEEQAPGAASEGWQWPADGPILTRFNGTTVKGIDIGGKVGDPVRAKKISDVLLAEYGVYVQPINFPTVPRGTERLRFTPSPVHDPKEIDRLVKAMDALWQHCALNRAEASA